MKKVFLILLFLCALLTAKDPVDLNFIFDYTRPWGELPREIRWSQDESQLAVIWNIPYENGWEIWTIGIPNGQVTRRTFFQNTSDQNCHIPHDLKWHPNGKELYFLYAGHIYHLQLNAKNSLELLTTKPVQRSALTLSPDGNWLVYTADQQLMLLNIDQKKSMVLDDYCQTITAETPELDRRYRYFWSPDGQKLAIIITIIPDHPKHLAHSLLRVLKISANHINSLELPINNQPAFLRDIAWTQSSESFLIDGLSEDHTTRYIANVYPLENKVDTLYREYSDYWIPAFGRDLFWIKDYKKILFGSTKNGYHHLYTLDLESKIEYAVTRGKWDIHQYQLTSDRKKVYFTANKENPLYRDIYAVKLKNSEVEKISYKKGTHRLYLAPSGKKMVEIFSSSTTPPKLYYAATIPKSKMIPLVQKEFQLTRDYTFLQPQFNLDVRSGSNTPLGYKLWIPDQELSQHKFPLIVHLRNNQVRDSWDELSLFNYYLMRAGCVVLECGFTPLDKFRSASQNDTIRPIFQQQLDDVSRLVEQVSKKEFIDPAHRALYGNHYAGYLTSMALFTRTDWFCKGGVISALLPSDNVCLDQDRQVYTWLNTHNPGSQPVNPIHYYNNLKGELVFIQGTNSSVAPLLPIAHLVQKMIADQITVEIFVYPWESYRISSHRTRAHLFGKLADHLLAW